MSDQKATAKEVLEARKQHFEDKQEAKIERAEELADKHAKMGKARLDQASKKASVIPFGQPILVGHHSEKRDRRYRAGIQRDYEKGFEHQSTAAYYNEKAERIKSSTSIHPDDPEALQKLKQKLIELEENQAHMKAANKILRSKKFQAITDQEERITYLIENADMERTVAIAVLTPNYMNKLGYERFELSNNNANIRRVRKQVQQREAELKRIEEQGASVQEDHPELRLTVIRDNVENRIKFKFDGRVTLEVYQFMKGMGFRTTRDKYFQRYSHTYSDARKESLIRQLKDFENIYE